MPAISLGRSCKNQMVTGTSRNITPAHAVAVHPNAMLARSPATGPLMM
jgi:hypothetical protein